jgi:hypothetical protein
LNDSAAVDTLRRLDPLASLTSYFWRVRASNASGYSAFPSAWRFITKKIRKNVTASASITSQVVVPVGHGNPDREVIRDDVAPPIRNNDPLDQYDTNSGLPKQFDWIGYTFTTTHRFSNLEFQEGVESDSGGWFASLTVEVRINGMWVSVQDLAVSPPYDPNNGINYESYELNFDPVVADGIRLAGTPGGDRTYISVAELHAMDDDTSLTDLKGNGCAPSGYTLEQNYPNPFNPSTMITFNVPEQTHVLLTVYDMLGQQVSTLVDGVLSAGRQVVRFSGDGLANGVYIYALKAGPYSEVRRMVLMK